MKRTLSTRTALWLIPAIAFCIAPRPGVSQALSSAAYSQHDHAQSLLRDVSFVSPPQIASGSTSATMDLRVVEVVNRLDAVNLKHRSYNGGLVGPTVRVRPGQLLKVRLQNDLAPENASAHPGNVPHGFNTTNLHTHGLHVSPNPPADDVFKRIGPGSSFNYEFQIPPDHPPGTFWYHAHKHGSTALQLASGMSGALIVEGGLDDLPRIKAADEKILVLQQFIYKQEGSTAIVDADHLYSGQGAIVTAINGVVTPTITMRPGEVQRWRLIHAGTTEAIFLDAEGVTFHEIAVDGLATGRMVAKSSLQLYPGYRSDILVKAPLRVGARLVYSLIRDPDKSIRKRQDQRQNVLRLVVAGAPLDMPLPSPEALQKVAAFGDQDVPGDDEIVNRRELRFSQDGNEFLINGQKFDPDKIEQTINLDTAEEWKLISESGVHPFHIHVNPFAVKPDPGSNAPWVWRDTVVVRRRRPVTIRTRYATHSGKTVLHCHNLIHEDYGMMQAIEIVDGTGAAISRALKTAPNWTAVDGSGRKLSSSEFRGKPLALVFHRGMECLHCAEQMTTLKNRYQSLRRAGIRLVAISPRLPDPSQSAAYRQFPFPILLDSELKCFRDYACLDERGRPLHGIFLIDRRNHVLLEHRTETAMSDPSSLLLRTLERTGD